MTRTFREVMIVATSRTMPSRSRQEISSEVEPKRVTAIFFNEDRSKQYSALMTKTNGNQWVGTANLGESDTFTLTYITVATDAETYTMDVPAAQQTKVTLYLGLRAAVYTTLSEEERAFPLVDRDNDGNVDIITVPLMLTLLEAVFGGFSL